MSCHITQQFSLQDVLSFLILLARLKRLIVFPAYRLVALSARNIPHDVSAGCHVSLTGIAGRDVDDVVEEVRFAMLATEILIHQVSHDGLNPPPCRRGSIGMRARRRTRLMMSSWFERCALQFLQP